jgi:Di-haem cytochrome c peroxidase
MFPLHRRRTVLAHVVGRSSLIFITILLIGCGGGSSSSAPSSAAATGTPGAEASVGERLFVETRFAQAFKVYLDSGGNVNDALLVGDPVMDLSETTGPGVGLAGPFAGLTMNCRACHLVDEHVGTPGGGMRTYADFAQRSPLPNRSDGKRTAPRNSPSLVNASLDRPGGGLFHFDGEFSTMEELTAGTFTGRNFGWLPGQKAEAIAHIARVIRSDDGSGVIAQQFDGLPYRILFTGTNSAIPDELRLPPEFRVFIGSGSDQEIFDAAIKVVAAYVKSLQFSQAEESGALIRSPFDVFLSRNGLPQEPNSGETPLDYSRRLLTLVNGLTSPQFVTSNPHRGNGLFQFHAQPFQFGAQELEGLKIFLAEPSATPPTGPELSMGKIGNCLACHAGQNFTDFKLHNTGTTQREYDSIHGVNSFAALIIPNLAARNGNYNGFLPATEAHPNASERFRAVPVLADSTLTDLGVWNVFANPDMPNPQEKIRTILCDDQVPCPFSDATLLDRAIARFKTPGLRDLSHSAPFMHNGQFATLNDIIDFYIRVSSQSRAGMLRNGAVQLQGIALTIGDIAPLVAFLKSLNEDYQ